MIRAARLLLIVAALTAGACTSGAHGAASPGPYAGGLCDTAPDPGFVSGWQPPSETKPIIPYLINGGGDMSCGPNRLLFLFLNTATNSPISDPARTARIAFYNLARDSTRPTTTVDAIFVWAIANERGDYVVSVNLDEAGLWGAEVTTKGSEGASQTSRLTFQVPESSSVVRVGQQAPSTKTPTVASAGGNIGAISSDPSPDPALYATSVDDDLAAHRPFVPIFATPKFCVSAQCGPTLDRVKAYVADYPTVAFIHAEPYQLTLENGELQPVLSGNPPALTPSSAAEAWRLPVEPWVFVVDRSGTVRGSFELIFTDTEIRAVLEAVK
jgi:hypothetical protein